MHPFKKLLLISLGKEERFEKNPTAAEWAKIFYRAKYQTLLGVLYQGVVRLPDEQLPPEHIMKEWTHLAERIAEIHAQHEDRVKELEGVLGELGLRGCVLKGTGLSHLYPRPSARQSGDIDVWVEGTHRNILKKFKGKYKVWSVLYQECKVGVFKDVTVEVHFHPSKMYNPFLNARLQRWFEANGPFTAVSATPTTTAAAPQDLTAPTQNNPAAADDIPKSGSEALTSQSPAPTQNNPAAAGNTPKSGSEALTYPSAKFNAVFCMAHMFRHYLEGGIGFRQMMDYYYLLQVLEPGDRKEVMDVLRRTGMGRFTGAVMHVLKYSFRLEDEFLLCEPNRKFGSPMIREILALGNFGVLDKRNIAAESENVFGRFLRKNSRVFSKLRDYPCQVLWSPIARISQFAWRVFNGYV